MGGSWSWSLRLVFLASLLLLSSALPSSPPPRHGGGIPPEVHADEALLARMCDPRGSHPAAMPLSWCHELRIRRRRGGGLRRHHHQHRPLPLPPPGRDGGEDVDMRYGVAKRLVPTGPNPLHN